MGVTLFERFSPEYALCSAFEDMHESGLDGLKKHLTANALKNVESFQAIAERPEVGMIASSLFGGNALGVLLDKLSECEWTIKDVMKGSDTSKAVIGFNYEDMLVGTMEMTMIKEDKIWKIDGIAMPKFDKFTMSKNKDQASE